MENIITWFEIPATDLTRAKSFYQQILNVSFSDYEEAGYKMSLFPFDGQNVSGSLVPAGDSQPSTNGTLIFLNAGNDLQDALDKTEAAGGKVVSQKMQIDSGYVASIIDTEGNKVGLFSKQ